MRSTTWLAATCLFCAAVRPGANAMSIPDLPVDAPHDAVMASPDEVRAVQEWAASVFAGLQPQGRIPLEVRRQDHSVLQFGRSCIDTPLRIGSRAYKHGLGTHANSEIVVSVPEGARAFRAAVGVDNNDDTGGLRGTVQFAVTVEGREAFRTPTLRCGQAPVAVDVPLPAGTRSLLLTVSDAGDGAAYDQADWADARIVMQDGSERMLDAGQSDLLLREAGPPFSFIYGGKPSSELLAGWERTVAVDEQPGWTAYHVTWTDPASGLCAGIDARAYKRYPAVDWVLTFENKGKQDTPILENVQALDCGLRSGYARTPLVLRQLTGDTCSETAFKPLDTTVEAAKPVHLAPTGGRPSSMTAFPWFNVQYADQGVITAIGWTGQWAATLDRSGTGPGRMTAGMELTHLKLQPGERIRSPRIVVLPWRGDRQRAHLQFRRLALFHYAPRIDGKPARLPIALQTFDRYWKRPGWATESGQIDYARVAHEMGCDTLWLDAAWFPGGFPNGVGSWRCVPEQFPRGLKPVSDACHAAGMRFVLWFEPERVAPGSDIAREHPEFVHGGAQGGLFKLDDPAARRWLTDLLAQRIEEYGIDVYRQDFNMDPLPYWRAADAPDRQGITEIRYVEGLYAMWDELRQRHAGLLIDNCSSGGRRIDLEMCSRSVPLWRSDTSCSPGHLDWNQLQSAALGLYVPLFTAASWGTGAYEARSAATGGGILEWGYLEPGFSMQQAKQAVAEVRECAPFWYGDMYPLTPANTAPDQLAAWQLHRADLDSGVVLAFRRAECPYVGLILGIHGVKPDGMYQVDYTDDDRHTTTRKVKGKELAEGLAVRLPRQGSSLLIRYRPAAR